MKKFTDDRFREYLEKGQGSETKLAEWLSERQLNKRTGKPTARVDYLIKNEIDTAESTLKNLEKLSFLY
jgi:hypothetical protein